MSNYYAPILRNWIFPFKQKLQKRDYLRMMAEAQTNQYLSRDALRDIQFKKLTDLLDHTYNTVPFYKKSFKQAGVTPEDIRTWDDYKKVPILTKNQIRDDPDQFLSTLPPSAMVSKISTSGSTGIPLTFGLSQVSQSADLVCRYRALKWWGVELGDRYIELWGTYSADEALFLHGLKDAVQYRIYAPVSHLVMNRKSLTIYNMTPDNLEHNWRVMQNYQPKYLFGYASAMYVLAQYIRERGYDGRSMGVKLVVTIGEILYDWQREEFAKVFGCPTADEYGAAEVGVIAYGHPCGEMHIMDDYKIVEIIKSDPQDEFGEVIVTNLENWDSPLIRYNLQDLAFPLEESYPCPLSLGFSRFESVVGRHNDTIRLSNGRIVHSAFFPDFMLSLEYVHKFQVNQKLPDSFEVLIVTDTEEEALEAERYIQARMYKHLGTVDVCVKRVPAIPTEESGKFRLVRSEVEWNDLL